MPLPYQQKDITAESGSKIQIKYRGLGGLSDSLTKVSEKMVPLAQEWLVKTIGDVRNHKNDSTLKQYLSTCFKLDSLSDPRHHMTILAVLNNTYIGIKGDVSFKIGGSSMRTTGTGYVAGYVSYTLRTREELHGWKAKEHSGIHMSEKTMTSIYGERHAILSATQTFVHEATHKYAKTWDFGDQGYMSPTNFRNYTSPEFREAGITTEDALLNADSYAWFVLLVGRCTYIGL